MRGGNGDGSVKIILNDLVLDENGEAVLTQYNSESYGANINVALDLLNFKNSTLLTELKKYYNEKLLDYDEVIENTKFCTDLSYQMSGSSYWFKTYNRLHNLSSPISKCSSSSYIYEGKIGSLTSDEAVYAGVASYITNSNKILNKSLYLHINNYKSRYFHTISPNFYYIMSEKTSSNIVYDFKSGGLVGSDLENKMGIRPVISIKGDTKAKGIGTSNNPYELIF